MPTIESLQEDVDKLTRQRDTYQARVNELEGRHATAVEKLAALAAQHDALGQTHATVIRQADQSMTEVLTMHKAEADFLAQQVADAKAEGKAEADKLGKQLAEAQDLCAILGGSELGQKMQRDKERAAALAAKADAERRLQELGES